MTNFSLTVKIDSALYSNIKQFVTKVMDFLFINLTDILLFKRYFYFLLRGKKDFLIIRLYFCYFLECSKFLHLEILAKINWINKLSGHS